MQDTRPPPPPPPPPQPATALPDIVVATVVRDLPLPDLRALAATSRTYRTLVARVAVPRLLFLLSRLLFATVRLGKAAITTAAAADVGSQRPPTAPSAASHLAGSVAYVAEIVTAAARSLPVAASDAEAAAAAAIHAAMGAVWSHTNAHWFVTGSDLVEKVMTARRRTETLKAIERAAAVVVLDEDGGGGSDGDDARRSAARGILTGLSSSERLNMWRAAVASGAENIEEPRGTVGQTFAERRDRISQLQWIRRATFIAERLSPQDIEAALVDIISGLPAEPCSIANIFSIMDCCLELLPTPATTLSAANAPLKPRLARALALALFRTIKEHTTAVDLWRCIQRARRLLMVLEAKLNECLRVQLVAPHVQALDDVHMSQELEVMLAGARRNWEQFLTVAFCETWEVDLTRAPADQLVERCFSELRRVAGDMYDAFEAATQDS
ncbi:hypothetical protein HK405_011688 [Cladochytrium tenue]|nr:hypothetical protein HK405_011688 [Cladochytrium tenue]